MNAEQLSVSNPKRPILEKWKARARSLKRELMVLYRAYRDPRTPWYGKAIAALVVAFAFSPIDLIPDPIPVLGYLDDLVLVPLGIVIAIRLIPDEVLEEARAEVEMQEEWPVSWVGAVLIAVAWLALMGVAIWLIWRPGAGE